MSINNLSPSKKNNDKIFDWLFVVIVIVLLVFKYNDLFLPYFWDELGVYSQGAVYQYHHGLSLMPASLPPDISRGHPLLFVFMNAIAMKVFGCSVFVAHSFNLFISITLLGAVYHYVSKYFNRLTAIVSVALLASQPVFLSQSALVLPEVMLSLFVFLSLANYFEGKYLRFALFASLAILTKESAVILPCVALCYSGFTFLFFRNTTEPFRVLNLLLTLFPYLIFSTFLLIQKSQNGWYFFPYHIDNVQLNAEKIALQFSEFFDFIFWSQGRYWWMKLLLIAPVFALLTNRLNRESFRKNFLVLQILFILAFLSFSSLSFYMERYVVAALIPASVVTGFSIVTIFRKKFLVGTVTILLCFSAFQHLETGKFNNDFDMGYRRQVNAMQQAIDFCYGISSGEKSINGNFPVYSAVNFPESGYLKKDKPLKPKMNFGDESEYFILSEPGDLTRIDHNLFEEKLLKTFRDGYAEVRVYQLKRKKSDRKM